MALKFLSRDDGKQRILRIDLARLPGAADREARRALVVTAEADRLTSFWNVPSGEWRSLTREHAPLRATPVGPGRPDLLPWSRRNGVAMEGEIAAVVFKRQLDPDTPAALCVDLLVWSAADAEYRFAADAPLVVPLDRLRFSAAGADLWAWLLRGELLIVAQLWPASRPVGPPIGPPIDGRPASPRLVLLRARVDPAAPDALADPASWRVVSLDEGGFDFDVRLEGRTLWAVHRRGGEAMSLRVRGLDRDADTGVIMIDAAGSNPLGIDESAFVDDMPPMVLLSCDVGAEAVTIESEDLPSVEHPQLQRTAPVVITGDRLRMASVSLRRIDGAWRFEPRVHRADKVLIWRGGGAGGGDGGGSGGGGGGGVAWRMERIGPVEHGRMPLNLGAVAGAHWSVEAADDRVWLSTLLPLKPASLLRYTEDEKGSVLLIAREDRMLGAVAAHEFRIAGPLGTGNLVRTGMSLLDIAHEQIPLSPDGRAIEPAENTQFAGHFGGEPAREGGGVVAHAFPTVNTLGGLLVTHQDDPHALMAYVGMGDGGGRVIFDAGLEPPAPVTGEEFKTLPPEIVTGPGGAGCAWVDIVGAGFIPCTLPGYAVPYSDVMRRVPPPSSGVEFALITVPAELILGHFTPRSLGGGLQALLDVLPVADAILNPESGATMDDLAPEVFDLDTGSADAIQAALGGRAPASDPVPAGDDQPFPAGFTVEPGVLQARLAVTFAAAADDPGGGPHAFAWRFTPPEGAATPVIDGAGPSVSVVLPLPGRWGLRLRIDAADGRRTEINAALRVGDSLWDRVWAAHTAAGNEQVILGTTTFSILRHRIEYRVNAAGARLGVRITYLNEHGSAMSFTAGPGPQQGRAVLRLPLTLTSVDGAFTGLLGAAIVLERLEARFHYERPFTLGVVTSDRRSLDLMAQRTFAAIDSDGGRAVDPAVADVETARHLAFSPGRAADMTPSALAAKPVGLSTLTAEGVDARIDLTPGAQNAAFLVGVIIGLGLVGPIMGPLMAAVLLALGPVGVIGVVGLGVLAVLVVVAIGLGLAWLFRELAKAALSALGTSLIRSELTRPETVAAIAGGLDDAGVMTYAGEGLAESVAIHALRRGVEAGLSVEPPAHDRPDPQGPGGRRRPTGRERFRPHAFETVVVGPGVYRVLLRVG